MGSAKHSVNTAVNFNAINKNGETGFHLACAKGNENVIDALFRNSKSISFDFNAVNSDGYTGFHLACAKGILEYKFFRRYGYTTVSVCDMLRFESSFYYCGSRVMH